MLILDSCRFGFIKIRFLVQVKERVRLGCVEKEASSSFLVGSSSSVKVKVDFKAY